MTIYTLPKPFATEWLGEKGHVVAYMSNAGRFVWVSHTRDRTARAIPDDLCPRPPIPEAAKPKPKVGEVWIAFGGIALFPVVRDEASGRFLCAVEGGPLFGWYSGASMCRPATPEEAEPFRQLLENLKASLGET